MANISIVNYCNLKCSYCFANDMIKESPFYISKNNFEKVLSFMRKTYEPIGIIGGEPTLHPDFNEILKLSKEYRIHTMNRNIMIFSNGIKLLNYIVNDDYFFDFFNVLLNINNPDTMEKKQWGNTLELLNEIHKQKGFNNNEKVWLGYNLFLSCNNYDYIWDIVEKYKITKLRIAVTVPRASFDYLRVDKENYYLKMKPIFIDQVKKAIEHNTILTLDCNNIPPCYFTEEELKLINNYTDHNIFLYCDDPIVDIVLGKKISACFGAYDLIDHDLFDFNDMGEVRRYLKMHRIYPKVIKNGTGKCATCKRYELAQCQGGCLGFVK